MAAGATVLGLTAEAVRQVEPANPLLKSLLQVGPSVVSAATLAELSAIIGAVAAILLGARQAGRNAEHVERMRKTIKVQRQKLDAASRCPNDRDAPARRMRDSSF